MRSLGLFCLREVWLPTWRGLLVLLALVAGGGAALLFGFYPFLSQETPHDTGALVMEGWIGDEGIEDVIQAYRAHHYTSLYSTGQPVDPNSIIRDYGTYANYGAARLHDAGWVNAVAVPSPTTSRDRTFSCAVSLRDWLRANGGAPREITLITAGPHARRSRLLFQKAFGQEAQIGVIGLPPHEYDPQRWWRSSAGFREVTGEAIAYLYARFLFSPAER